MGTCSSKKLHLSIDVKGNNNYAVLINGVQINLTSVVNDIINRINKENRTMMIIFSLFCIFLMLLSGIIIMSFLFRIKYRSRQSHIIMEDIENALSYLIRKIRKLAYHTEHLTLFLLKMKTYSRAKSAYANEYLQSLV